MTKSHTAGRGSQSPTPAQLKELFAQIDSGRITKRRMQNFLRGDIAQALSWQEAREIMGSNFFGVDEWRKYYKSQFKLPDELLDQIANFPWDGELLEGPCPFYPGKVVKETHFASLGLTDLGNDYLVITKWHALHHGPGHPKICTDWQKDHDFAHKTSRFGWHLMLIGGVPSSEGKAYPDQQRILPDGYEVPRVVDRVSADLLYFRRNITYMDDRFWSRCQDKTNSDLRVYVGAHPVSGVYVDFWNDGAHPCIRVAASRKPPN